MQSRGGSELAPTLACPTAMEITGKVVGLDEQSFELADDADERHRFSVALDAYLEAGELRELQQEGARVVVIAHADMPGLPVAYRVFRAPH